MQASKIKVGKVYAVMHGGKLRRFNVSSVTTIRTRDTGSPHDYHSEIGGAFIGEDGRLEETAHKFDPEKILGPYEEHAELVAEKKRLADIQTAKDEQRKADAHSVCAYLYTLVGEPVPPKLSGYDLPFRIPYGQSVEIGNEGIKLILAHMKQDA